MRRFLLTCLGLLAAATAFAAGQPRPATPEEVALFKDAMLNSSQDTEHWAYTETTTVRTDKEKAKPGLENVVRFDPSKPYAEQYTPLKIDGKPPSEKQLKQYRKQGEERGRQRARRAEEGTPGKRPPQLTINDSKASLDLDHPRVVEEGSERITFEVPLVAERGELPVEKFQILAEVDKTARQLRRAHFRIRHSFRMKLIAKIKSGEAVLDFTVVDPEFGPVITSMAGNFGASFMFIPVKATFTSTRMEWKRVKAFDERFNVKLDPLQFPGF